MIDADPVEAPGGFVRCLAEAGIAANLAVRSDGEQKVFAVVGIRHFERHARFLRGERAAADLRVSHQVAVFRRQGSTVTPMQPVGAQSAPISNRFPPRREQFRRRGFLRPECAYALPCLRETEAFSGTGQFVCPKWRGNSPFCSAFS